MNKNLNKNLRIPVISLIIIVLILALTNPSMKSFKEFGGVDTRNEQRVANYLIFSIYQREEYSVNSSGYHTFEGQPQYINFYRK